MDWFKWIAKGFAVLLIAYFIGIAISSFPMSMALSTINWSSIASTEQITFTRLQAIHHAILGIYATLLVMLGIMILNYFKEK